MLTLFQGDPGDTQPIVEPAAAEPPKLLVELPCWPRVFFGNAWDLLADPFRRPNPLVLTSQPAPFWPDVFVNRRLPVAPLRQSVLAHLLVIIAVWGITERWVAHPHIQPRDPFANSKIVYYPVSEYLPPLNEDAGSEPAKIEKKGDPVYARQRIVSLPRNPDNSTQTIVTPSPLTLHNDVPLPNIVAWTPVPAPAAAGSGMNRRVELPPAEPVAPPPEARARLTAPVLSEAPAVAPPPPPMVNGHSMLVTEMTVVAPPPTVSAKGKTLGMNAAAVVAPPPALQAKAQNSLLAGDVAVAPPAATAQPRPHALTLAAGAPVVPPPATAVNSAAGMAGLTGTGSESVAAPPPAAGRSRASAALSEVAGGGSGGGYGAPVVAPPVPAAGTGGNGAAAAGQLIALGIHPVAPNGPVQVPAGNRRGTFAAGPEGKPGAAGTPDIHGGGVKEGPGGHGTGTDGAGSGGAASPTAGIMIAAGPVNPGPVAMTGSPSVSAPAVTGTRNALIAAMRPSRPMELARETRPDRVNAPEPKLEDAVFGPKKFYQMTLNMPNLTSTRGSWIIRFAELKETRERGELTAPVATVKVDPAYPTNMMRDGVQGVVVLYAVIRADGSVGEVRVIRSLNTRLDDSARTALLGWHFRPATKNGSAVDLEAVVQIPFQSQKSF